MKIRKKFVYYCDFCKRRYMTGNACEKHERRCTLNENRNCGLCDIADTRTNVKEVCDKYAKKFDLFESEKKNNFFMEEPETTIIPIYSEPFTLQDIIDDCEGCPNCILTVIRCLGLSFWYFGGKFKYDYKNDLEDFWHSINQHQREVDERGYY